MFVKPQKCLLIWSEDLSASWGLVSPGRASERPRGKPTPWSEDWCPGTNSRSGHSPYSFTTNQASGCTTRSKLRKWLLMAVTLPAHTLGQCRGRGRHVLTSLSYWSPCRASSFQVPFSVLSLETPNVWTHFPASEAAWMPNSKRKEQNHTHTYLEEKIRLNNVLQIKTVRISKTRKLFSYFKGNRFTNLQRVISK